MCPRRRARRSTPRGAARRRDSRARSRSAWRRTGSVRTGRPWAPSLSTHSVGREHDADDRSSVLARFDGHPAVERARPLGELLIAGTAPFAWGVIGDHGLDVAPSLDDANRDALRRPTPDRVVQRLADDLEDRDLRVLGERLRSVDVEVDLDAVRHAELLRERADGWAEALVAQYHRLQLEREVAQRADRLPLLLERRPEHLRRLVPAAGFDRVDDAVEHERDA